MQDRWRWPAGMLAIGMGTLLWVTPAVYSVDPPTLEDEIEAAVQKGIVWLVAQQQPDGGWGSWDRVAYTGLAVLKLETRAIELGMEPLDPAYEYSAQVKAGLEFLTGPGNFHTSPVAPGEPDGNGNGTRAYFTDTGWHQIYQTGIAMMALSASGQPVPHAKYVADAVDYLAWAQQGPACGVHYGGWHYDPSAVPEFCDSDNSNSGYATLGLGYAAASPPWGFAVPVPASLKAALSVWIDVMQDDVNGDPDDGGSWYNPGWPGSPWVNILKTGNLLYEMCVAGDPPTATRIDDAVAYIVRHWNAPGGCDVGWKDHRQAMFAMMKGLEIWGIDLLDLDGDTVPETAWFDVVARHLLDTQQGDGSWPWDCWGDPVLSTCWAMLTLERAIPPKVIPIPFDIKPTSCPNPVNRTAKGLLPAAIPGTADLDVMQIDPASVVLLIKVGAADPVEVPVLRWWWEDVATPYEPFTGKEVNAHACTWAGPDGIVDLTLKFDVVPVNAALAGASVGDVLVVKLTANLLEEFGGIALEGEDVIVIVK